jgi:Diacylglycerol kinase
MGDPLDQHTIRKTRGLRHVVDASRYSWGGLKRLTAEPAFRLEVAAYLAVAALFALSGAGLADHAIALILFLVLLAVEALNTAIEELVDRVSPEISDMARHAKDLGSFAVGCLLVAGGVWALSVLARLWL